MILRIDRHATELPPPSDSDPDGVACVQELLGGRFGEMSTLMNYTFQSFSFRNRQGARPFYKLVANIAAEELGHIELVSAAINTMLTDPSEAAAEAPDDSLGDAPRTHATEKTGVRSLLAISSASRVSRVPGRPENTISSVGTLWT